MLGLDHPSTLFAAGALTRALISLGLTEPACALSEDNLQRSRRLVGPQHPITLYLLQAASSGQVQLGDDAAEDHPSRPL